MLGTLIQSGYEAAQCFMDAYFIKNDKVSTRTTRPCSPLELERGPRTFEITVSDYYMLREDFKLDEQR